MFLIPFQEVESAHGLDGLVSHELGIGALDRELVICGAVSLLVVFQLSVLVLEGGSGGFTVCVENDALDRSLWSVGPSITETTLKWHTHISGFKATQAKGNSHVRFIVVLLELDEVSGSDHTPEHGKLIDFLKVPGISVVSLQIGTVGLP